MGREWCDCQAQAGGRGRSSRQGGTRKREAQQTGVMLAGGGRAGRDGVKRGRRRRRYPSAEGKGGYNWGQAFWGDAVKRFGGGGREARGGGGTRRLAAERAQGGRLQARGHNSGETPATTDSYGAHHSNTTLGEAGDRAGACSTLSAGAGGGRDGGGEGTAEEELTHNALRGPEAGGAGSACSADRQGGLGHLGLPAWRGVRTGAPAEAEGWAGGALDSSGEGGGREKMVCVASWRQGAEAAAARAGRQGAGRGGCEGGGRRGAGAGSCCW